MVERMSFVHELHLVTGFLMRILASQSGFGRSLMTPPAFVAASSRAAAAIEALKAVSTPSNAETRSKLITYVCQLFFVKQILNVSY